MNLAEIPEGPTRVRIVRAEQEIPAELVYNGVRPRDGKHVWECVSVAYLPGDQMVWDALPLNTAVVSYSPGNAPSFTFGGMG